MARLAHAFGAKPGARWKLQNAEEDARYERKWIRVEVEEQASGAALVLAVERQQQKQATAAAVGDAGGVGAVLDPALAGVEEAPRSSFSKKKGAALEVPTGTGSSMFDAKLKGKKVQLQVGGMGLQVFVKGRASETYMYQSLASWGLISRGQHCHSTMPLTIIDWHPLGSYILILLSLLSFPPK